MTNQLYQVMPDLSSEDYEALKADIAARGVQVAVEYDEQGNILDGHHRLKVCQELGITDWPRIVRRGMDEGEKLTHVLALNMNRRHLTQSQKATIAVDVLPRLEEAARQRQRAAAERTNQILGREASTTLVPILEQATGRAVEQASELLNVAKGYVSDAKKLKNEAPDLYQSVRDGQQTITEAKRELKERGREEVREQNRQLVQGTVPITTMTTRQTHQTIVLDPPWDWGDEGDVDQYGRARPTYGTMSIEQITALPVGTLADRDAHIYLWITNRSLPKGFGLLDAWGFRYVTMLTWVKPSFGMGNYFRGSTEQVLFGVRGSLPLLRHDAPTHLLAPRPGQHSGKPDAFYELVESCSPGPWLEMFSRKERQGWLSWGAEVNRG